MRTDLNNIHERYNYKMRWETARKKESKLSTHRQLNDAANRYHCGNIKGETERCEVNLKSKTELMSTDVVKVVTSTLPSSDDHNSKIVTVTVTDTEGGKYKFAMGTEHGKAKTSEDADSNRNETAVMTENKENEVLVPVPNKGMVEQIKITNGVTVTQREKDSDKRREKQRDLSDDDTSNEDSENECTEHEEEVTKNPVLNANIPSDSVSDVENQLKDLAIAPPGGEKGELCERSPMGNERHRARSDLPYPQVSSKLRCNGGGIVAESFAPTDSLYRVSQSATVPFNINDLLEPNNNILLQSASEYPFGEELCLPEPNNNFLLQSSPVCAYSEESCPLPVVEQVYLDIYLNDDSSNVVKGSTENTEVGHLTHLEVGDDPNYNSPNIYPEQSELYADAVSSMPLSYSLPYRQAESIASLSSPSSGSRYSSECSPSSSPVPSLVDSVTGKSDSDTENELLKIESNLQIGYSSQRDVSLCCAQSVNNKSLNKFVSCSVMCGHPGYQLTSHPYMKFHSSDSITRLRPVQPVQPVITVQSVQPADAAFCVRSATNVQLAEPARDLQAAQPGAGMQQAQLTIGFQPAQSASCLQPAQLANSLQPAQTANCLQPAQPASCLQLAQPVSCLQPAQSVSCLLPAQSTSCLQPAQLVNCLQPAQPANCLQPAQPANCLQPAQPANCLQPAQPASCLQLAQPTSCLQPAQSLNCLLPAQPTNCLQPPQSARSIQQSQLAIGLRQSQPAPPTIRLQTGLQNIQLASSANSQAVISQSSVHHLTYTNPQQPNIQQGPVIPETIAVSARERMDAKLDKTVKDCAVRTLAKLNDDQLAKGDERDGDTQLMILITKEVPHMLEYIYVMVSRLKNISGALVARNAQNHSALRLACVYLHRIPFVARFIAEVMLEKGLPINEVDTEGNTLLHLLCAKGDSHVYVLAELLSMKDHNNAPCFDINQHNHTEGTPLHKAVKTHSKKVNCSQTVAFLLSQGADVLAQERCGGLTALHLTIRESCDPLLVQLLLQAAERRNISLVNKGDYPGDTALHFVALRNDIALHQQARVVELLVRYGAVSNRCGSQGRTPLALVSAERKREIQKIIHKR